MKTLAILMLLATVPAVAAEPSDGTSEGGAAESSDPGAAESPDLAPVDQTPPADAPVAPAASPPAPAPPTPAPQAQAEEAPLAPAPPQAPASGVWEDRHDLLPDLAEGGVDVCEAVAFPLTLLPAVGTAASTLIEWVCLVPAAMAVDYYGLWHAGTGSFLWQPLLGLLIAKIWRTAVLVVGVTAIVLASVAYSTVAVTALLLNDAAYYIPVGLTGVLTIIGALVIGTRWAQKRGSEFWFRSTYFGLSRELDDDAREKAQEEAWYKPPPDPFFRAYALMSAAAGAEPHGDLTFAIPVAGPLFKAAAKADAIDDAMMRIGHDVLGEEPQHEDAMRFFSSSMSWTEGALGAGGQALLVAGGALFVTGTVVAAVAYQQNTDLGEYAVLLGGLGGLGVVVAGGGVGLILLREVPRVVRNLSVPLAFGLLPPAPEAHEVE